MVNKLNAGHVATAILIAELTMYFDGVPECVWANRPRWARTCLTQCPKVMSPTFRPVDWQPTGEGGVQNSLHLLLPPPPTPWGSLGNAQILNVSVRKHLK